jgi:uncharacterized protein (TIGR00255 family)
MIKSMTGFGRGESDGWTTEIRTVNHRFADIAFRFSRELSSLERRFKEEIKKRVKRGRVEVYCSPENPKSSETSTVVLDEGLADQIYQILKGLNERYGFRQELDLGALVSFREIFKTLNASPDFDRIWTTILPSLETALESLDRMRLLEGENLLQGLKDSLHAMEEVHRKITDAAPQVVESYRERLINRMETLVPGDELDRTRLLQEVALFADRSDITEELTRLKSHIDQFYKAIDGQGSVGRRLEFLLQEMNREVNTIGSKGNDLHISQWVVECKSELEKMREQVQNIE